MFPSQICHCPLISSDQKRLSFDHCVINFGGMLKREAQEFQFVRLFHLSHNPLQFERKIATCSFSKIKCGSPDLKHLQKFICFSTRWLSQECEGAADWFVSGFSLIADCLLPSPFFRVSHAKETGGGWGQGHAQDMCDLHSIVWIPQITPSCSGQMPEKLQVSGSRLWVFSCPSSSLPTLVSLTVFTN